MKELFYPRRLGDLGADLNTFIISPHAPKEAPLNDGMRVACVGSCFAQEIAQSLQRANKPTLPLFLSERQNTAFALAHTFANAFDGTPFPDGFLSENVKGIQNQGLLEADAFIITLGLSLCWYERSTNRMVFSVKETHTLKGIQESFANYELRQTSVQENVSQIGRIVSAVRRLKPDAPIIFTLSPIPLQAVTSGSPITGNAVSKATLRVALNEVMSQRPEGVFYWPSYEIVEWVGSHVGSVWGQDGDDQRHLKQEFIDAITKRFIQAYYPPLSL